LFWSLRVSYSLLESIKLISVFLENTRADERIDRVLLIYKTTNLCGPRFYSFVLLSVCKKIRREFLHLSIEIDDILIFIPFIPSSVEEFFSYFFPISSLYRFSLRHLDFGIIFCVFYTNAMMNRLRVILIKIYLEDCSTNGCYIGSIVIGLFEK
jgi:hypothetical protein